MAIFINGKEMDLHGLAARAEARAKAGLYPQSLLELLGRDIREELERGSTVVEAIYELDRVLQEKGIQLEPPSNLAREGERLGRWKSLYRRAKTRFIRAVNEGYVQQQERFNSFLVRGIDLAYLQLCDRVEGLEVDDLTRRRETILSRMQGWDEATVEAFCSRIRGRVLVVMVPGLGLLQTLRDRGLLALAVDLDDALVARGQAEFLPIWHASRPLHVLGFLEGEVGTVLVSAPEFLAASELLGLASWSAGRLVEGGKVFLVRKALPPALVQGEEACARPWPAETLRAILESCGLACREERLGSLDFLVGEVPG
jgi:hypothetical protein